MGADEVGDSSPTRQKKTEMHLPMETTGVFSPANDRKISSATKDIPGLQSICFSHLVSCPVFPELKMKLNFLFYSC
jgi:hypothetical protein